MRLASRRERKRWNRQLSREGTIANFDPSVYRVPSSSREINVCIDTSRPGSRLASSPPQCVPRQMFLSIRRRISCLAVRLACSPHPRVRSQRGSLCLAICDGFARPYLSRFLVLAEKKKYATAQRVSANKTALDGENVDTPRKFFPEEYIKSPESFPSMRLLSREYLQLGNLLSFVTFSLVLKNIRMHKEIKFYITKMHKF